jgi:hypothetical protein
VRSLTSRSASYANGFSQPIENPELLPSRFGKRVGMKATYAANQGWVFYVTSIDFSHYHRLHRVA